MNRAKEIEKILDKVEQMTHAEKEEVLAGLQIISGKVPTNPEASCRIKQKVAESLEKGNPIPAEILRYFTG